MGRFNLHLGITLGLLGSAVNTVRAYREGGMNRVIISWTGYDSNYGWNWKWATSAVPLIVGAAATFVAVKSGINKWTPTGINI